MRSVLLVLTLAAADQAPTPVPQDPASAQVERVRAALEKPSLKLTLPEIKADFSVHIEERRPLQEIFETPPWQLPPTGWHAPAVPHTAFGGIPMLNLDLLAMGGAIARGVNEARRAHAERAASEEVRQAIAEYCAGQPNGGVGVRICTPPWR